MPDDVFLRRVGAAAEQNDLVLLLRRAIAQQCGLKPEVIEDTADCEWLIAECTWDGWDPIEFVLCLEEELGIAIDESAAMKIPAPCARSLHPPGNWLAAWFPTLFGSKQGVLTVAEWIRAVLPLIQAYVGAGGQPPNSLPPPDRPVVEP